jgi:hypothetical protein
MSHDRFTEAHYFLHRMEENYHDPAIFRYTLNAFISANRAVHEMLRVELESKGEVRWWKDRRREFSEDGVLSRFALGRNITLHQRAIFEGSRVSIGLFRGRRLKMTLVREMHTDETSAQLLQRLMPRLVGEPGFVDEAHTAIGEEVGVQRLYFVRDLSEEEDVLRASRRALARTSRALSEAHNRFGAEHIPASDHDVLDDGLLESITVLLESDLDPEAHARWGWY